MFLLCYCSRHLLYLHNEVLFSLNLDSECLTLPCRGGIRPPLRFFLHNSKTPGDIKKKLSDFNFTPFSVILRILSITIAVRCCHSNLLFPACHVIFGVEKQRNLNYFQDNYLIKLKFGTRGGGGLFLGPEFKFVRNFNV